MSPFAYTGLTYVVCCPEHGASFIERSGPAEGEHGARYYRCAAPACDYEVRATGGGRQRTIKTYDDSEEPDA